jgi:hypothetical protein
LNKEQMTHRSLLYSPNQPSRLRRHAKIDQQPSTLQFDQYVAENSEGHSEHDELLFGEHNYNGGFTVHRNNGVEIGLRTKLSYPVIENEYNSNGDGTYSWDRVGCDGGEPIDCKVPHWSMEFSVATNSNNIKDYCWELGMDADPSEDVDFTTFDPISKTKTAAFFDHSFGRVGVAGESNSIQKLGIDCTYSFDNARLCAQYYGELLANYNVAQNYWNFGFASLPGTSLYYFDRAVSGNYVVYLRAIDCRGTGEVVAESYVQILVGNAKKVDSPCLSDASQGGYQGHTRTMGCPLNSNLEFSQDVSPEIILNAPNGGFTTDRRNCIEIGLRTRQRFEIDHELDSDNIFHDNGGVYWWARSNHCADGVEP